MWVEEGYPTAAAIQLLDGKALYKDIWFDKPPLSPYLYLLWGARTGWPLRVAGAIFIWLCCLMAYRFARDVWGEREGLTAALLLGFFLTFGIPAAVIPLAPDLLMVLPHLATIYFAWRNRPFLAGLAAGFGVLVNPKSVYVFAACFLWIGYRGLAKLALAFLLPNIVAFSVFGKPYLDEVWKWGLLYAGHTFVPHPITEGLLRTANWLGFQCALIVGAAWWMWRERKPNNIRAALWAVIMLCAVTSGWRFFPRYYFILLVPLSIMAARGFVLMGRWRAVLLALLLIPLIRFGPRYYELASDLFYGRTHQWTDLAMMYDSEAAARMVSNDSGSAGTLLVWGYRPDIFAYTRMQAGTRYLDSQPLTGVLADRHLDNSEVLVPEWAVENRRDLIQKRPTYIADGLGLFNPKLAVTNYPDLAAWFHNYREIGRTGHTIVYKLLP